MFNFYIFHLQNFTILGIFLIAGFEFMRECLDTMPVNRIYET